MAGSLRSLLLFPAVICLLCLLDVALPQCEGGSVCVCEASRTTSFGGGSYAVLKRLSIKYCRHKINVCQVCAASISTACGSERAGGGSEGAVSASILKRFIARS